MGPPNLRLFAPARLSVGPDQGGSNARNLTESQYQSQMLTARQANNNETSLSSRSSSPVRQPKKCKTPPAVHHPAAVTQCQNQPVQSLYALNQRVWKLFMREAYPWLQNTLCHSLRPVAQVAQSSSGHDRETWFVTVPVLQNHNCVMTVCTPRCRGLKHVGSVY